jgi:hypothetical protein
VIVNPEKDKNTILLLSDYFNEIRYIKLQTSDACILEKISKVLTDGENVFISTLHSSSSRLLFFSSDGLFIREIGHQGRGPGEFSAVLDFDIDRSKKTIYILDTPGNILEYDYSGRFIKTHKSESRPSKILLAHDVLYLFTPWPNYILNKDHAVQTRQLSDENKVNYLINRKPYAFERTSGTLTYTNFFAGVNDKNNIDFFEEKFDTLYCINSKKIGPRIVIDLKKDIPRDLYSISDYNKALQEHRYNTLSDFISIKNYLFFKIISPPAIIYYYTYNKSTSDLRMHDVTNDKQYFFNDIDGGYTFKPEGISENGVLYSVIDCYKLIDHFANTGSRLTYRDKTRYEALKKLVTSSKIDDNPVIMLVTLK